MKGEYVHEKALMPAVVRETQIKAAVQYHLPAATRAAGGKREVEGPEPCYCSRKCLYNRTPPSENSVAVAPKIKPTPMSADPEIPPLKIYLYVSTSKFISKRNEHTSSQKDSNEVTAALLVYSQKSITNNSQMTINRAMSEQTVTYSYKRTLLSYIKTTNYWYLEKYGCQKKLCWTNQ